MSPQTRSRWQRRRVVRRSPRAAQLQTVNAHLSGGGIEMSLGFDRDVRLIYSPRCAPRMCRRPWRIDSTASRTRGRTGTTNLRVVGWATLTPHSAIISTRSRYDSRHVMYHRKHRLMMSASHTRLRYIGSREIGFVNQNLAGQRAGSLPNASGCTRNRAVLSGTIATSVIPIGLVVTNSPPTIACRFSVIISVAPPITGKPGFCARRVTINLQQ